MKIIYSLLLACSLCFAPALINEASARIELSDIDPQQITLTQSGNGINVFGAVGKTVYVYNLIGVQVMAIYVDSPEKHIDLSSLPHGIYPIKVGNVTKKIRL